MSQDESDWVASRIVKAIEKGKNEALLRFPESLFARIKALLPRIVNRALKREQPSLIAFTRQA